MKYLFDLNSTLLESELILLPVPWDNTATFRKGTSHLPFKFKQFSSQIDPFDRHFPKHQKRGFFWDSSVVDFINTLDISSVSAINNSSSKLSDFIYDLTSSYLSSNKKVLLLGGDHSCSFGAIKSYLDFYPNMGILQIDSHMDLRDSYENLFYSHASIMFNVTNLPTFYHLTQVGIRDYSESEYFKSLNDNRIVTFFDDMLTDRQFLGDSWDIVSDDIVSTLPDCVYLSLDVDGLTPFFNPHTGTPVPGGICSSKLLYLISKIVHSGRKFVGFDFVEGSSIDEDVISCVHLFYRLSHYLMTN